MLLLNKHYVEHSHVPTLHGQRKELMHLVNYFYPEDDFASVMAKAHKKTNAIHSEFMGREHPLFHGGVVTKAVGVCVDGCQYRPRVHTTSYLDGSDEIAMEAPSSAPEPHQVNLTTYRFADPTSGPVARSHSSLD